MAVSSATKSDKHRSSGGVTPWMSMRAIFVSGLVPALALFLPAWTLS